MENERGSVCQFVTQAICVPGQNDPSQPPWQTKLSFPVFQRLIELKKEMSKRHLDDSKRIHIMTVSNRIRKWNLQKTSHGKNFRVVSKL